jgi:hypothetical protein
MTNMGIFTVVIVTCGLLAVNSPAFGLRICQVGSIALQVTEAVYFVVKKWKRRGLREEYNLQDVGTMIDEQPGEKDNQPHRKWGARAKSAARSAHCSGDGGRSGLFFVG